jgi:hypothetical protein
MRTPSQQDSDTPDAVLKETSIGYRSTHSEIDLSLLLDSLTKTPWERMQANDDALNFAESLRTAMERCRAKPQ